MIQRNDEVGPDRKRKLESFNKSWRLESFTKFLRAYLHTQNELQKSQRTPLKSLLIAGS